MYSEKPLLHARQSNSRPGTLRTIALDVTGRCNMTCSHCYADTFMHVPLIEEDVLKSALDQFYDLGVFHYVLQGGEPITEPRRLEFILKNCHPDETYINVVSNGWAMTPEKIKWLRELKVDKVSFSMDSGIASEHDANRLAGSYDRVVKAIDDVIDAGLFTSVSVVVTHQSLYSDGFKRALAFVQEKGIRMDCQIAEPVGKWDGMRDLLITPEDAAYIKNLQQTLGKLPNGQTVINRDIYCGDNDHCPAGVEFMALSADGNFLPCNFLQFTLGNIRDRPLADMRARLIENRWFDGTFPDCLCGQSDEFIDTYIAPYTELKKPLEANELFKLRPWTNEKDKA